MMADNFREALLTFCLDELEAGVPADELLSRYPEIADELQPLIEMSFLLEAFPGEPSLEAEARSLEKLMAQGAALNKQQSSTRPERSWWSRFSTAFSFSLLAVMSIMILMFASLFALPSDVLYPLKKSTISIILAIAPEDQVGALEDIFDHLHVEEIIILMETGRTADVQGEGFIEWIEGDTWQVYGIEIQITPETVIVGDPQVGAGIKVEGTVRDGKYFARHITIVDSEALQPAAEPDQSP